jgi:CxxC motif-containing protein
MSTTTIPATRSSSAWSSVTNRVTGSARDLARGAQMVARDVTKPVRGVTAGTSATATKLAQTTTVALQSLPKEAVPELAKSVYRLRKVRTPAQATEAVQTETERLLTVITPLFVEHPLPVANLNTAKAVLATAGGLAAASEEIETIAAFVTGGAAVPPTLPIVIGANLVALAVELYVIASMRVHDLRAAGMDADPGQVADDVIYALAGESSGGSLGRHVSKHVVRVASARLLARWGAGLVPFVGIAYAGWDSQRTADAIRALPLPARSTLTIDARLAELRAAQA